MVRAIYTKHFAERFLERCGDMEILKGIKRKIHSRYCEHVFDCLVHGNPRRVVFGRYKAVILYIEEEKQLYVKTFY